MGCYERAMGRDLFAHAAQVDRLLSPSCKRSFCSVLSLTLQAGWLPDGLEKLFSLGYCRAASLYLPKDTERERIWQLYKSTCIPAVFFMNFSHPFTAPILQQYPGGPGGCFRSTPQRLKRLNTDLSNLCYIKYTTSKHQLQNECSNLQFCLL